MSRTSHTVPGFMETGGRRLFTLEVVPTGPCRGAVLYLPPFAEEMNRLRSHAAAQARALAAQGLHCLILDLSCTGDSEGELIDADWERWRADAVAAAHALATKTGHAIQLWGARTGALLAAEAAVALVAAAEVTVSRLLFWQPVLDGQQFINQYLRLRVASLMVSEAERETTEQIRARLDSGDVVEVAGYPLGGSLARGLSARHMRDAIGQLTCEVCWVEMVGKPEQTLLPASRKMVAALETQGVVVHAVAAISPPIWQVHDRAEAPGLLAATLVVMEQPALRPQA